MDFGELKEEINTLISISQLAGSRRDRIQCPFHNSKDLDMVLYHDSNRWRCFGRCDDGRTHDIFDWMQIQEGLNYVESLHALAERAGISLKPDKRRTQVLTESQRYYSSLLANNTAGALDYLGRRGFSPEYAFHHHWGYSDDTYPDIQVRDLIRVGLVRVGDWSGTYSVMKNRIVYPVYNKRRNQVNMQGRLYPEIEGRPKYLGLEHKTDPNDLRGPRIDLCLGGEEILSDRRVDTVFFCEGWPDRETLAAWNIPAVCKFGHGNLYQHAWQLRSLKRVYAIFDNDPASQTRIHTELFRLAMKIPHTEIYNVLLPEGQDVNGWAMAGKRPGSFLDPEEDAMKIALFMHTAERSKPFIEDLINAWGNTDRVTMLLQLIATQRDKRTWIKLLSEHTGQTQGALRWFINKLVPVEYSEEE